MIRLDELKLSDLLPSSIRDDKEISAIAAALDKELQSITACINEIVLLPRIDELPEDIIDSLAWQFHVDFYEPLGLDINKKRALVKSSLSWHRHKGTKSVLEEIIRILFLEDFEIEEWYEYGGEPYFFRLIVNDTINDEETYKSLIRAVHELKNVRSWLEGLKFLQQAQSTVYIGTTVKHVKRYRAKTELVYPVAASAKIYTGVAIKHVRRCKICCRSGGEASGI